MEAGDTIYRVEAIRLDSAELVRIDATDCQFAYRDSIFKRLWKNQYLIARVIFRLTKKPEFRLEYGSIRNELDQLGGEISLKNIRRAIIRIRQEKLPDVAVLPNAGSFFKNPVVSGEMAEKLLLQYPELPVYQVGDERRKLAAGWMIEQCGWKGRSLGKAGVHKKQALVLVNEGGADGTEVACLANEIKKSVFLKFGVWLEPEVYIV